MNIEMSQDIDAAIKHSLSGGRVLANIKDTLGDECICEVWYDNRFNEWDCAPPAHSLKQIEILEWMPIPNLHPAPSETNTKPK